jgi:exonuclease III
MPTLTTNIIGSNNYFSLISLNINGLNSPLKRQTNRLATQTNPTFCCLQETHLREKDRHYLKVKGWKTIFQANGLKKQAGVAILFFKIRYSFHLHFQCYPKSPPHIPPPTSPPTHSHFLALAFPCTEAYKVCKTNGTLFPLMAD